MSRGETARARLARRIVCAGRAHALLIHQERLPIETDYAGEVAALRRQYPALGQVMALENLGGAPDLARLVGLLWTEILAAGLDAVLIAVAPRDAAFYRRLGFMPSGLPRRPWLLADDAEVEVLLLDVAQVEEKADGMLDRLRAAAAAGQPVSERYRHG